MGCKASVHEDLHNLEEHYRRLNLPKLDPSKYSNEFEKEAFMTLAVIRADPALMSKQVASFKINPMCKGQPCAQLAQHLVQLSPLPITSLDVNACKACRVNTDSKVSRDEADFEVKGNSEAFRGMPGDGPDVDLEDDTVIGWTGSAQELIIWMLIDGYNKNKTHPILDPRLLKVGIHFIANKRHNNIFQILYLKKNPNQMQ